MSELKIHLEKKDLNKFLRWQEIETERVPAVLEFDGKKIENAKIKIKGHTSKLFPKRGISIKLSKKNAGPLLFNGLDEITLNPMFTDKSYMREKLTWDLFASMQGFGPRALGYVHIFLNEVDYGLYIALQPVEKDLLKAYGKKGDDIFEAQVRNVPGDPEVKRASMSSTSPTDTRRALAILSAPSRVKSFDGLPSILAFRRLRLKNSDFCVAVEVKRTIDQLRST